MTRNTLKLLPASKSSKTSKVVVGDDTGMVTCFGVKKREVSTVFTIEPTEFDKVHTTIAAEPSAAPTIE